MCGTATPTASNAEMRADLTVACDGRASTLRSAAGLAPRSFGAPMDVWWFRLPRARRRPARASTASSPSGHGVALIDRGDYFQIAYLIRKGTDAQMRAEGIESLRRQHRRRWCRGWRTGSTT